MKDFLGRLSSRKFLLTIAGLTLVTLFPEQQEAIILFIGMFVGVEGVADVVGRYTASKTAVKYIEKDIALIESGEIPAGEAGGNKVVPGRVGAM